MSSIFSGKAGRQAAMFQAEQLQKGLDQGNAALDKGYSVAETQYGKAGDLFGNLADSYAGGSKLYQDALGVNGQAGSDAARSAYTTAPGYTFNMDQGLQALSRARAVNGTLASGGADTDAMKFASGLASQDYNNWLTNLNGLDTKRYGAVGSQAGTFGALGSAALGVGSTKAGLAAQTAAGVGQAGAQGLMAGQQAAENRFGALMGGANLIAKGAGALSGNPAALSNIGSNLSSAFSIFG